MTREQLDAIRTRVEAGTTRGLSTQIEIDRDGTTRWVNLGPYPCATHEDAAQVRDLVTFIHAARQDVPALLAEVERLTAERDTAFQRGVAAMRQAAISRGPCPDCTECDRRDAIITKADAALAAHDAVPPSEVVWKTDIDCTNDEFEFYEAYPDAHTGLDVVRIMDGKWRWTACREVEQQGYCNTLDEAQRAALAAARGMR